MAKELSISQPLYNMIENGNRPVTEAIKAYMAKYIDVTEETTEDGKECLMEKIEHLEYEDSLFIELLIDRLLK